MRNGGFDVEKTLFLIKPDGVARGLVGEILGRIEKRGFIIEKLELRHASSSLLREHYKDLVDQPFFPKVEQSMTSGPLVVGIISGPEVISSWRTMMGPTNPKDALPGTIRGDLACASLPNQATLNVVHGSDSQSSAEREIALWFKDNS